MDFSYVSWWQWRREIRVFFSFCLVIYWWIPMETNASKTTSNGQFSKRFHVLYNAKNFANFKLMKKYIQTEGLGRSEKNALRMLNIVLFKIVVILQKFMCHWLKTHFILLYLASKQVIAFYLQLRPKLSEDKYNYVFIDKDWRRKCNDFSAYKCITEMDKVGCHFSRRNFETGDKNLCECILSLLSYSTIQMYCNWSYFLCCCFFEISFLFTCRSVPLWMVFDR